MIKQKMKSYDRILLLIGFIILIMGGPTTAQGFRRLSIGDSLPDFEIPKMFNGDKKLIKTSDFSDQLLIIDFWGTTCGLCIELMPEMDKLQLKFGNRIKILPVSIQEEKEVRVFWRSNFYTKNLKLSSVVEDKRFTSYFPNKGIPHEVWVYKGIVIAITGFQYVDEHNINKVLNGEQINWAEKNDLLNYEYSKPLFANGYANQYEGKKSVSYAAISGYRKDVSSYSSIGENAIVRDTLHKTLKAYFVNFPLFNLYHILLRNTDSLAWKKSFTEMGSMANQVVWEVKDPYKFRFEKNKGDYIQEWNIKNQVCIEVVVPDTGQSDEVIYKIMLNKLNQLLGLNVHWEKRIEEIYVISNKTIVNKGTIKVKQDEEIPFNEIVNLLNNTEGHPYVYGQFQNISNVYVKILPKDIYNYAILKSALAKVGLGLDKVKREMEKMVFK